MEPFEGVPYEVTSEEEARKAVEELAGHNVDVVTIWVNDNHGTVLKMAPAVYCALIDEAHQRNLKTITHLSYLNDAKELVRSGVDAFAQPVRDREVDDELIALMKENNVSWSLH